MLHHVLAQRELQRVSLGRLESSPEAVWRRNSMSPTADGERTACTARTTGSRRARIKLLFVNNCRSGLFQQSTSVSLGWRCPHAASPCAAWTAISSRALWGPPASGTGCANLPARRAACCCGWWCCCCGYGGVTRLSSVWIPRQLSFCSCWAALSHKDGATAAEPHRRRPLAGRGSGWLRLRITLLKLELLGLCLWSRAYDYSYPAYS